MEAEATDEGSAKTTVTSIEGDEHHASNEP
jgi:hypothetical protein